MNKLVFTGLVLISGLALAGLWVASPGCEGSLCLGSRAGPEGAALTRAAVPVIALQDRVTTEDLERIWMEAEPAQTEPGTAPAGPVEAVPQIGQEASDPLPVEQAKGGPEVIDATEMPPTESYGQIGPLDDGDFSLEDAAPERVDPEVAEARDAAAFAAINEPDDELRGAAINEVGNRRDGEAVAVLTDAAFFDPVAGNRYQALESLWYSAADGLDGDGAITRALREAANDPNERIAELAEKALADLDKLEKRREQEKY